MSLSFLPRGVAARRALTKGNAENSTMDVDVSQPSSSTVSSSPVELRTKSQTESGLSAKKGLRWRESKWQSKKQKQRAIESRELALLLEASMSDYSLWKSQDLRRYAADKNTQGYISLSRLMTDAPLLRFLGHPHSNISTPNESQILQALKSFGTGFLELQMKVVSTSQYKFSTKSYLEHSALSTYNIRRWDWNSIRERRDYDFSVKSKLDAGVENIGDSNRDEEHTMDAGRILWDRTQDDWESRTVYVENIPRSRWSIPGILSLIYFLFPDDSLTIPGDQQSSHRQAEPTSNTSINADRKVPLVQFAELPARANAYEDEIPTCKGFVFITFGIQADAAAFVDKWPWSSAFSQPTVLDHLEEQAEEKLDQETEIEEEQEQSMEDQLMKLDLSKERDERSEAQKEAKQSGLRALSMTQWNELKREYLARQTSLLQKMKPSNVATTYNPKKSRARANPSGQKGGSTQIVVPSRDRPPHIPSSRARQAANEVPSSALDEAIGSNDRATEHAETLAYPPDCLVFVKNLYPGTNKTTLKSLFGRPFAAETSTKVNAIDYVDYQKGMASCHVRLSHPSYARTLVNYLTSQPISQADGLDAIGQAINDDSQHISAELVQGRAEAIYWEKVPDKVKSDAVVKLRSSEPFELISNPQVQYLGDTISSVATPASTTSPEETIIAIASGKKISKRVQDTGEEDLDRDRKRRRKA